MKKLISLTFCFLCLATFTITAQEDEIFKEVEQMPMFPGCEGEADYSKAMPCAQQKMLEYIYSNIKYPPEAREKGVEGTAIVQFIINKEGRIENPKLLRDPGAGTGDAALAVVNKMNTMESAWEPGTQRGKKVKVQYTLPIKFKLQGGKKKKKKK